MRHDGRDGLSGGPGEPVLIDDEQLRFLVLGFFRGVAGHRRFPLEVDRIVENYDERGTVASFTIITVSGLRYRVRVDFEGGPS